MNDRKTSLKISILRLGKALGVFHLTRRLARRKLLILCYHGFELDDEAGFRPTLFMQDDVFKRRLDAIHRSGSPVLPLAEALERLRDGTLPDNAVCLTIDDGFYSVLKCAAPALQTYRYPATLYATSYYISKQAPIFRLVVQYMFWKTGAELLDVSDQPWGPVQPEPMTTSEQTDRLAWQVIEFGEKNCDESERQRISEVLGERLQIDYASLANARLLSLLTPDELRQMADFGIDVQLHTHRHTLPVDDEAAVRTEIMENTESLRSVLGREPTHFCYPSGVWDRAQWPWLKALGIESATTCNPCLNSPSTPMFGLYRIVDDNETTEIEIEAELYGFSEFIRQITGRRKELESARRT